MAAPSSAERSGDSQICPAKKTSASLTTSQDELMKLASDELKGSCKQTKLHGLPLKLGGDPDVGVLADILEHVQPWASDERKLYSHVCDTLNVVVSTLKAKQHNLLTGEFVVYDKPMLDGIEGAHPMKPDLLLTFKPLRKHSARWRDVFIPVKVKSDWKSLINQAATYARALFHARKTRIFSVVIGINHQTKDARFLIFHRGGLTSSPLLDLKEENGLPAFLPSTDWECFSGLRRRKPDTSSSLVGTRYGMQVPSSLAEPVSGDGRT